MNIFILDDNHREQKTPLPLGEFRLSTWTVWSDNPGACRWLQKRRAHKLEDMTTGASDKSIASYLASQTQIQFLQAGQLILKQPIIINTRIKQARTPFTAERILRAFSLVQMNLMRSSARRTWSVRALLLRWFAHSFQTCIR